MQLHKTHAVADKRHSHSHSSTMRDRNKDTQMKLARMRSTPGDNVNDSGDTQKKPTKTHNWP